MIAEVTCTLITIEFLILVCNEVNEESEVEGTSFVSLTHFFTPDLGSGGRGRRVGVASTFYGSTANLSLTYLAVSGTESVDELLRMGCC